jgi:hypothetical protein
MYSPIECSVPFSNAKNAEEAKRESSGATRGTYLMPNAQLIVETGGFWACELNAMRVRDEMQNWEVISIDAMA